MRAVPVAQIMAALVGATGLTGTAAAQEAPDDGADTDQSPDARRANVDEDGWVHYDHDDALEGSSISTLAGELVDGACHWSGSGNITNDRPIEERSLAVNLRTCEMVLERGVTDARPAPKPADGEDSALDTVDRRAPLLGQTGGDANTCCFQSGFQTAGTSPSFKGGAVRQYAYHKTYWEDPPNLDVNTVESQVDWTADGSCANLGTTRYRTYWYWLSGSGWSRQSNTHNGSRACGYATTVSTARYFNGAFCANQDIWAHYDGAVSITGQPDGRYNMSWDIWLETNSALCSALLSFHREHGYFTGGTWGENH